MKIGIDISQIIYGTGVSSYTKSLVRALLALDGENQYCIFGGSLRRKGELEKVVQKLGEQSNVNSWLVPSSPMIADFLWNRLHKIPIEVFTGRLDIFHSSDWSQPPSKAVKVTTIHDLVPLLFPESSHPKIVAVHKRRLKWVSREVARIIAVSQATKKDIVTHLGIPSERISVIYEAPDAIFKKADEKQIQKIREKYKIPQEYLLAVGADPRKNINRIAQAVDLVSGAPTLVVVGRRWDNSQKVSNRVIWLDYIIGEELAALYSGAMALVYASLYEGFGLPILAAMKCGCPVVTSNISSMPEVAGDAAVLVNPESIDDIARGLDKVISDKNTRDILIKKGFARAEEFSWEKTAKETLAVYREAAKC